MYASRTSVRCQKPTVERPDITAWEGLKHNESHMTLNTDGAHCLPTRLQLSSVLRRNLLSASCLGCKLAAEAVALLGSSIMMLLQLHLSQHAGLCLHSQLSWVVHHT